MVLSILLRQILTFFLGWTCNDWQWKLFSFCNMDNVTTNQYLHLLHLIHSSGIPPFCTPRLDDLGAFVGHDHDPNRIAFDSLDTDANCFEISSFPLTCSKCMCDALRGQTCMFHHRNLPLAHRSLEEVALSSSLSKKTTLCCVCVVCVVCVLYVCWEHIIIKYYGLFNMLYYSIFY